MGLADSSGSRVRPVECRPPAGLWTFIWPIRENASAVQPRAMIPVWSEIDLSVPENIINYINKL